MEYAFIGGLSISQALLIAPLATTTTRLYGTRITLLIGVFLETLALVGASFSLELWQLFLSQGLCYGFGLGFLFVGSVGIIPQWFTKKRSLANSVGAAGSGLGGMMYSLAANAMIETMGIQWAYRVLAIIAFVANLVCALVVKDRNRAIGAKQLAFDHRMFQRFEIVLTLGWGFFSMLGYVVLLFSLPSYALSIGLSARQGSIITALFNLGQGLGRPLVGMLSDRAGRINIAGSLTFFCGFFCLVGWICAKNFGVLIFFAMLVGTVSGTFWATIAPVMSEVVGLKELPSALSLTWLVLVVPTTCKFLKRHLWHFSANSLPIVSEPIALGLRRTHGNRYLNVQVYTGLMYIAASACLWGVRAWKIGTIEHHAEGQGKPNEEASVNVVPIEQKSAMGDTRSTDTKIWKRVYQLRRV